MANEDDLMKQQGSDFQDDPNQEEFTLPDEPTDDAHTHGSEFEDDLDLGLGDESEEMDLAFDEQEVETGFDEAYGEGDQGQESHEDDKYSEYVEPEDEGAEPVHSIGWKTYTALGLTVVLVASGLSFYMFGGSSPANGRNSGGMSQAEAQEIIRQRAEQAVSQSSQQAVSMSSQPAQMLNPPSQAQAPVEVKAFPGAGQSDALVAQTPPIHPPSNSMRTDGGGYSGGNGGGNQTISAAMPSQDSNGVIPDPSQERDADVLPLMKMLKLRDMEEFQSLSALANNNRQRIVGLQDKSIRKEEDIEDLDKRVTVLERKLEALLSDGGGKSPEKTLGKKQAVVKRDSSEPKKQTKAKSEKTENQSAPVAYKPEVPETPAEIKALQRQLAIYGYRPGPIDGLMGSKTREAIKRLQREHGLPDTGWLSGETLLALVKPKHYSGTYAEPKRTKYADHPRDERSTDVTWYVRGVTPDKAVVYRIDGMSYAVSLGTEIPGMGQVTKLDPANHQVRTAHGVIGKR